MNLAIECYRANNPMPLMRLDKKGLLDGSSVNEGPLLPYPNIEYFNFYKRRITPEVLYLLGTNGNMQFIHDLVLKKIITKKESDEIEDDAAIANFFHAYIFFIEPSYSYCLNEIRSYLMPYLQELDYPRRHLVNYQRCLLFNRDDFSRSKRIFDFCKQYPIFYLNQDNALILKIGKTIFGITREKEHAITITTNCKTSDLNNISFNYPFHDSFFFDFSAYLPIILTFLKRRKIIRANVETQIPFAIAFIQHYIAENRAFFLSRTKDFKDSDSYKDIISTTNDVCADLLQRYRKSAHFPEAQAQ